MMNVNDYFDDDDGQPYGANPFDPAGFLKGVCQWTSQDGKIFMPAHKSVGKLAPGVYKVRPTAMGMQFVLIDVKTENLIRFPDANSDKVIAEITKFWSKKDVFKHYGLPYKRGILLYGPAGSGKTCTIRFIVKEVINLKGIAIQFENVLSFKAGIDVLRQIQPETPVVVIMEDLDSLLGQGESEILNLLDGVGKIENTVFLATTNYIDRLPPRLVNRPSRFDRRFEIGYPNLECRQVYLEHLFQKITPEDKARVPEIKQWVEDTEMMSIAHLKELFSATVALEYPYQEALEVLQKMNEITSENTLGQYFRGGMLPPPWADATIPGMGGFQQLGTAPRVVMRKTRPIPIPPLPPALRPAPLLDDDATFGAVEDYFGDHDDGFGDDGYLTDELDDRGLG